VLERMGQGVCLEALIQNPEGSAFSSEVETGSREENATKQRAGALVLIPSEPEGL